MKKTRLYKAISIILIMTAVASALFMQGCSCSRTEPEPQRGDDPVITTAPSEEPTAEPTAEVETTPDPEATPEPGEVENAMRGRDGSVAAIATGTYGVATDGTVRFMGRSVSGQCYYGDWQGVVQIAASDSTTAALMEDGTVAVIGEHEADFAEALDWTGVTSIAMGSEHLVGLLADGTCVAAGSNNSGQCNVRDWTRVVRIYACADFTAALTDGYGAGVLDTKHRSDVNALPEELKFVEAAVSPDHMLLLGGDGRAYTLEYTVSSQNSREDSPGSASSSRNELTELDWQDIEKVFAAEGANYGIDKNGVLHTDSELIEDEQTDVYTLSATADHAVLLYTDGTAEGFGENKDLQCNVEGWRLLPYVTEEGYMLGGYLGEMIGEELYRTGLEINYTDPITGESSVVTAVLLGDVNGDGAIDEADKTAMNDHIAGRKKLEGAYLRAANVIDDSARPGAVDGADRDALIRHIEGKYVIDQYAKTDMYTSRLANAKRVNTDALGYLTIGGTNIDYPLMYGDNWYYHSRGIDGKELTRGSLYTYWSKPGKNIVITGHNARTSGTMLHQLHYVQDHYARNFSTYQNRLWCINTYGVTGYWEVFSMYEEGAFSNPDNSSLLYNTCYPASMDVMSDTQIEAWIQYQQNKSQLNYTVEDVTPRDRFMTIVTCGDTHAASEKGSRLYFFLRWVSNN